MCSNIQPWAWLVEREERGKTIDSRTIPHLVKRVLDFGAHWRMFFLQEQMIKSGTLSPHQTVWKSAKTMSYSNFSAKNNFYWKSQFEYKFKAFVLWNFIFQWKTNNLEKMLLACEAIMNNRLFWKLAWWYSIMVLRKDRRVESLARKLHPLGSKCEISWWEWEEGSPLLKMHIFVSKCIAAAAP